MPHFHIEYSANLESTVNMGALCEAIRTVAADIEAFPTAGIRVRATRVDHVSMADGNPKHGFIDLSIRLREGRPENTRTGILTAKLRHDSQCNVVIAGNLGIVVSCRSKISCPSPASFRSRLMPLPSITAFLVVSDGLSYCLLYTSPSPRDKRQSRMPSSA